MARCADYIFEEKLCHILLLSEVVEGGLKRVSIAQFPVTDGLVDGGWEWRDVRLFVKNFNDVFGLFLIGGSKLQIHEGFCGPLLDLSALIR